MELGLDFDLPRHGKKGYGNIDRMPTCLQYVANNYGKNVVLVRKSSSGYGYHVRVMVDITPEEEINVRQILGDCKGRQIADKGRIASGMMTSRLFKYKGKTKLDNNYKKISSTVKQAKAWSSIQSV